jgi:ubiquitin C-terminal hydrolase
MSAPDGFDPKVSMLPDPGAAAAPIHTMRGGARPGVNGATSETGNNAASLNSNTRTHFDDDVNPEETHKILSDYQLGPGGILEDLISDDVKALFVQQIKSGLCTAGTGDSVIMHKDCSAVVQVLRELYRLKIQSDSQIPHQQEQSPLLQSGMETEEEFITRIQTRRDEAHAGSENCGNTCYINSSLQLLSYIPEVIESLLRTPTIRDKSTAEVQSILNQRTKLVGIFKKLYTSQIPINLSKSGDLGIFDTIFNNLHNQQDVEEFITKLFDTFYIDFSPFQYFQNEEIRCNNGQIAGTPEKEQLRIPSFVLRPPPPTATTSIQNLMNTLGTVQEQLEDVKDCITPDSDVDSGPATKTTTYTLDATNKYLFIALNRFDVDGNKLPYGVTVDARIEYQGIPYSFYSSILHNGNTKRSGHYIFLKAKEDLESGIVYDDSLVLPVEHMYTWRYPSTPSEFTLNGNAYVLIYKRIAGPGEEIDAENRVMVRVPTFTVEQIRGLLENPQQISVGDLRIAIGSITRLIGVGNKRGNHTSSVRQELVNLKKTLREILEERETVQLGRELGEMAAQPAAAVPPPVSAQPPMAPIPAPATPASPIPTLENSTENSRIPLLSEEPTNNTEFNQYANRRGTYTPPVPPTPATPATPAISPEGNTVNSGTPLLTGQTTNNTESNQFANRRGTYAPPSVSEHPVSTSNAQFYSDEYYNTNPKNFQEGHLRMNFGATRNNRRVYANATIGSKRTRIYGQNVANLQRKYKSRKRQQNAQVASQKAINLASGKKLSIGNRMKSIFKRGGNKTRRAKHRGTSRRRK